MIASAAMLAAAVVVALVIADRADSAFPGANGRIAFASDRARPGFDFEIFTMRPDGTGLRRLTTNGNDADDYEPAWSADASRIAFTGGRGFDTVIITMNADGTGKQRLTQNALDAEPTWSKDGQRIAFVRSSLNDLDDEIFSMANDGTDRQKLTHNNDFDGSPAHRPSGGRIVFDSDRDGDFDIYTMRQDGSDVRKLTHNSTTDLDPNWSPTGGRIVYLNPLLPSGGIFTMRADGSDRRRLTYANSGRSEAAPAYSPNGNWITFEAIGDHSTSEIDIWKMRLDRTGLRRLTKNQDADSHPDWGPVPP